MKLLKYPKKVLSMVFVSLIRVYQAAVSPFLAPSCRFSPSCSQYGIDAISKYGPFKGSHLTIKRILSCHPWGKHGHDPVP